MNMIIIQNCLSFAFTSCLMSTGALYCKCRNCRGRRVPCAYYNTRRNVLNASFFFLARSVLRIFSTWSIMHSRSPLYTVSRRVFFVTHRCVHNFCYYFHYRHPLRPSSCLFIELFPWIRFPPFPQPPRSWSALNSFFLLPLTPSELGNSELLDGKCVRNLYFVEYFLLFENQMSAVWGEKALI